MMRLLSVLLLLLGLCACAVRPPAPELPPGLDAETLVSALEAYGDRYHTLEAEVRLRLNAGGKKLAATQYLWVSKPAFVRAEVLNPFGFGGPLLLFASDGATLSVFSPGKGTFYRGEASAQNLMRFTRIPLQVSDLVRLVLYEVPLLPYESSRAGMREGLYQLELLGPGPNRQQFLFDQALTLTEAGYYLDDELQLSVRYEGQGGFPRSASFSMPLFETKIDMEFLQSKVNEPLSEARFDLTPPAGVQILPIP